MVRPHVSASPTGNSETRYRVRLGERDLGVWRDPEHSAARFLLDNGLASRGDTIRTVRKGGEVGLVANVGWLADHVTMEDDRRGLHLTKWRPFPAIPVLAGRPFEDEPVFLPRERPLARLIARQLLLCASPAFSRGEIA